MTSPGRRLSQVAMEEADILRAANELLTLYGDDAVRQAVGRADKLLQRGDFDGCVAWRRIAAAIAELNRRRPTAGESTR